MVRRNRHQQGRIDDALRLMAVDLGAPTLQTHKLSGKLAGLWACACGYDCRKEWDSASDRA
jgi:mRNA interferase YafQ